MWYFDWKCEDMFCLFKKKYYQEASVLACKGENSKGGFHCVGKVEIDGVQLSFAVLEKT